MWIFALRDDALMSLFEGFVLVIQAPELGVLGVACRFPLLPLDSCGRFAGDIIHHSVHAGDFGYDAAGDAG